MTGKFVSLKRLIVCALLSNSFSPDLVQATVQTAEAGVVRVDLERKFINHHFDNV